QEHGEPRDQNTKQRRDIFVDRRCGYSHILLGQPIDEVGIARCVCSKGSAITKMATDIVTLDRNVGDPPAIHIIKKIRKGKSRLRSSAGGGLEQIEKRDEKQPDNDP